MKPSSLWRPRVRTDSDEVLDQSTIRYRVFPTHAFRSCTSLDRCERHPTARPRERGMEGTARISPGCPHVGQGLASSARMHSVTKISRRTASGRASSDRRTRARLSSARDAKWHAVWHRSIVANMPPPDLSASGHRLRGRLSPLVPIIGFVDTSTPRDASHQRAESVKATITARRSSLDHSAGGEVGLHCANIKVSENVGGSLLNDRNGKTGYELDKIDLTTTAGFLEQSAEMSLDRGLRDAEGHRDVRNAADFDDSEKNAQLGRGQVVSLCDAFG